MKRILTMEDILGGDVGVNVSAFALAVRGMRGMRGMRVLRDKLS